MAGFLVFLALLMLVLYLVWRRKPSRHDADTLSSYDSGYSGETTAGSGEAFRGGGGEFGGAGASGSWGSADAAGGDGGGGGD